MAAKRPAQRQGSEAGRWAMSHLVAQSIRKIPRMSPILQSIRPSEHRDQRRRVSSVGVYPLEDDGQELPPGFTHDPEHPMPRRSFTENAPRSELEVQW